MLLPLLGACAVVGPFQGPEWEPVRDLLSQNRSCRDPRCCGNLLVLCLFLIWQVRHYWHQVTRTRPSKRNVIKVPLQRRVTPSMRRETFFGLAPEFFSPGKFRGLDAHIHQWAQEQRRGYRRSLQESWAQLLFSPQHPCQGPPWDVRTPSDPIFCTSSFPSTCLLPQDRSWEAWHLPWCLRDGQTHSALETCQQVERLLVPSQEKLVLLEHVLSTRPRPTSTTIAISLPNSPSAQNLQFCPGEFLPDASNQQMGMSIWKSWDSPQETWAPWSESQTEGRVDSGETQAAEWVKHRERGGEDALEIQASGGQPAIHFGTEDGAGTKALECRNQTVVISDTDGQLLIPEQENQMGTENRAQTEELGKKNQRESGGKDPPETQVRVGKNQEQFRCKTDVETQTPEWGCQDKSGGEGAVEIQAFERKNEKEARGEEEKEIQAQGLGKQGQTGGKNGQEAQTPERRKQNQIGGDAGAEIETELGRNKDQVGGECAVQTQTSGRENPEEVQQEDSAEPQAQGCGKRECTESETVTEIRASAGEKRGQGGDEGAGKTQTSRGEEQKRSRQAVEARWGNQGLGRGVDAGAPRTSRRKMLREIREEDWVVIQAHWWENRRLTESEIDKKFKIPCGENQNQVGGEQRVELQAPKERNQRKDGDEEGTNVLAPKAENQGQLNDGTDVDTHPAGRKNEEQFGDENRIYIRALGERNLRVFKGEAGTETQELGGEDQCQSENEFHRQIHISKWENQEHTGSTEDANTQVCETEPWEELPSKTDGETCSIVWKDGEQAGGETGTGIQIQGTRGLRGAGREDGTATGAAGEGSQSHLGSDTGRKAHLSEWENQEQMGGEGETEAQAPEKRKQGELGGDDRVKTQRPEREDQGQLESEMGGSCSPEMGSLEQNVTENQASEKRNGREAGSEDVRKIQRVKGKDRRLLRSKVHGKTCSSEWKKRGETRGGNGTEIQIRGQRNLRGTTGEGHTETHTPMGDDRGQSRRKTDGEIQTQEQGNQNEGGEDETAQVQDVRSQRKRRAEDAGGSPVPRRGDKGQVRGKDAARASLQGDCSGGEGPTGRKCSLAWPWPPALIGYGTLEQGQAVAVNNVASAPCPEMKPCPHGGEAFLLASGEGEHLASQGTAPAREHSARVSPVSQQARSGAQRRRRGCSGVDPGEVYGLTQRPQKPQTPSLPCGQSPQAAPAPAGAVTTLPTPPKWPFLKTSKRLLLEALMRRRIAHLTWGLPRRILESYLLFNFLGSCSLPWAGARPGQELQRQQEKHREGFQSPERAPRVPAPERKSSKLPTQARALERGRPHRSEPMGASIPPERPRRTRTSGGAREPQIRKEAPRAKLPAPRIPRPAAEPRGWCGPGRVPEPSSGNSRGRKMIRPGVSQRAERAPSRVRTGQDHWEKENRPWESSEPPRLKSQQPTYWRRSLEPAEARGAGRQPSFRSTDSSSFKGSLRSTAARLSMTLLSKMSRSPQLAKPLRSAPPLPSKVGDPHPGRDSVGVHTALKRELQPPGRRCAGTALPGTRIPQGQVAPGDPNKAPRNPPAPQKSGFMKALRCFLFQCGLKK